MFWWDFIDCRQRSRGQEGGGGGRRGNDRSTTTSPDTTTGSNGNRDKSWAGDQNDGEEADEEDGDRVGFRIRCEVTLVFICRKIGEEGEEVVLSALTLTLNVFACWPLVFMWIKVKLVDVPIL